MSAIKNLSQTIRKVNEKLIVPDNPIIPFIKGDGIGPEIAEATLKVIDKAVKKAYNKKRKIKWLELKAGENAFNETREYLPKETVKAIKKYTVSIKGPLTTPVGKGIRSLNVALRQIFDLYACIRPCKWINGVPAPVKNPEDLDIIIFRENTEDVYSGIEWKEGSKDAQKLINFLEKEMNIKIREDSGIGLKPISKTATERFVRASIDYALKNKRKSVTLVHKGNIMKYTEGAFRDWGYALAKKEYGNKTIMENEITNTKGLDNYRKIIIKDRITDAMFQQALLRPEEYDVIATTNLNGDYLSDACAAQVGGIGLAPSANINFESHIALFEPTHGTAPKYAGLNKANPTAMILSGVMMLNYLGWKKAGELIVNSIEKTVKQKTLTYDLARKIKGSIMLKTSEFGDELLKNI